MKNICQQCTKLLKTYNENILNEENKNSTKQKQSVCFAG